MASSERPDSRKKRYHRVVLVMGRNGTQDFFTRVLTTLVRIGLKNEEGMAPPNTIMKYMARMTQRSVNDKGLRTRVGRALQRGMENGLVTLKHGHFKLTRRAGVVADTKGKLWLKIPTLMPTGPGSKQLPSASGKKPAPKTTHKEEEIPDIGQDIGQNPQQQQHRQIQTSTYLSQSSVDRPSVRGYGCTVCRSSRPRHSGSCRTPSRYRSSRGGFKSRNPTKHNGHGQGQGQNNNNNGSTNSNNNCHK